MLSKEAFEALGRVFAARGWAESPDPPKNRRKAEWGWRDELAATRRTRSGTRAGRSMLCHYKGGAEDAKASAMTGAVFAHACTDLHRVCSRIRLTS